MKRKCATRGVSVALLSSCALLAALSSSFELNSLPSGHGRDSSVVLFSSAPIDTRTAPSFTSTWNTYSSEQRTVKRIYLVHFRETASLRALQRTQETLGTKFLHYVPSNTYLMYCTHDVAERAHYLSEAHGITWIGEMQPAHKRLSSVDDRTDVEEGMFLRVGLIWTACDALDCAHDLAKLWSADVGAEAAFTVASADTVVANVKDLSKIDSVVDFLTAQPMVRLVEKRGRTRMNNAFAHGTLQSGDSESSPLWDAGIDGTGEVIGIGDSGVDWNRCSFYDEKVKDPVVVKDPSTELKDNSHRKFKGYWAMMDAEDAEAGHGTHVCGSVGGYVDSDTSDLLQQYNGAAHQARFLFTDIGCQTKDGCECISNAYCTARCADQGPDKPRLCENSERETFEPDDLNANFFPWSYRNGARIHTNSWSEEHDALYRGSSQSIDRFLWEHKDFLVLFAASNEGDSGFYSVGAEGSAKNAVTVGASQTTHAGWQEVQKYKDFSNVIGQLQNFIKEKTAYKSPADLDTVDTCCAVDDKLPKLCTALEGVGKDCNWVKSLCCPTYISEQIRKTPEHFNGDNLASFSSLGFTRDGRIKPDVLAPGNEILSTKSQRTTKSVTCGEIPFVDEITGKSGTSMATPLLAGHAALIRQYFREGFWPTGEKNPAHGFMPSSALLKAVIVNSGRALTGLVEIKSQFGSMWKKLAGPATIPALWAPTLPSAYQGFGRVTLAHTLPLKAGNTQKPKLSLLLSTQVNEKKDQVAYKDVELSETGDSHTMCFEVTDSKLPLKVTMVYTDYPGEPSAQRALVNDLDLVLHDGKREWLGNQLHALQEDGSVGAVPDSINNVEQVAMEVPDTGVYAVVVNATALSVGPSQPFAIVATGALSPVSRDRCPSRPEKGGGSNPESPVTTIVVTLGVALMVLIVLGVVLVAVYKRKYKNRGDKAFNSMFQPIDG